jgi:hypothetical protein
MFLRRQGRSDTRVAKAAARRLSPAALRVRAVVVEALRDGGAKVRLLARWPINWLKAHTASQLILRPTTGARLLSIGLCNSYVESTASLMSRKAQLRQAVDF